LALTAEEAAEALDDAFRRGVLDREEKDGELLYTPTNFYTRMDIMATFETTWDELPVEYRKALDGWMLEEYIDRVRPNVELLMAGKPTEGSPGNDSVVLADEVDSIIDSAETIVVVPCDCRRIAQNCSKPTETCIQFDRTAEKKLARGYGRRLTAKEAKDLVLWADRKGLMHTTDLRVGETGPAPICNCCADDCYVFRAAERLGSKGVWPRSRYVASFDPEKCQFCGACVKRCHFGAFHHDGTTVQRLGLELRNVAFDATKCWGCGLCTAVCFPEAITLVQRQNEFDM
jgi:Pyruvate/2-oxoacid:ferredoxin oxidoreductase delta subunit